MSNVHATHGLGHNPSVMLEYVQRIEYRLEDQEDLAWAIVLATLLITNVPDIRIDKITRDVIRFGTEQTEEVKYLIQAYDAWFVKDQCKVVECLVKIVAIHRHKLGFIWVHGEWIPKNQVHDYELF